MEPELVLSLSVFFLCFLPDFFPDFELPVSDPEEPVSVLEPEPVEEPLDEPEPLEPVPLPVPVPEPVPVWANVSGIRVALTTTAKKAFFMCSP